MKQGIRQLATGYDFPGPHQGNFCCNGIVTAERDETAKLKEVTKAYQSVDFFDFDPKTQRVKLKNKFHDTNLKDFYLVWTMFCDGKKIELPIRRRMVSCPDCKPGEVIEMEIPYGVNFMRDPSAEYTVMVDLYSKRKTTWGIEHPFATEQFIAREGSDKNGLTKEDRAELKKRGIRINDLYKTVAFDLERYIREDDMIHLTEEGIEICSRQVADAILDVAKAL